MGPPGPAPTAAEEAGLQAVAAVWVDGEAGVQNFTLHDNLYLGLWECVKRVRMLNSFWVVIVNVSEAMYEAHCEQFHMFANEVLQAFQSVVRFEVITDSFVLKVADLVLKSLGLSLYNCTRGSCACLNFLCVGIGR